MTTLKVLVCAFFSSSFGMMSPSQATITSIPERQPSQERRRPERSFLSYNHQHRHLHSPTFIPSRQLTTTKKAIRKEDLCNDNNLGSLEDGLEQYFLYWWGASIFADDDDDDDDINGNESYATSIRYNCRCDDFQSQQQQQQQPQVEELMVRCHGQGRSDSNNNEVVELQDTAIFQKVQKAAAANDNGSDNGNDGDYYVLQTTWWGDSYLHSDNASIPQEVYHYSNSDEDGDQTTTTTTSAGRGGGQLLKSCHGRNCTSCTICPASSSSSSSGKNTIVTIEVDCAGYHFSCHHNYTGGFMNFYDFSSVPAAREEEQVGSTIISSGGWSLHSSSSSSLWWTVVLILTLIFCFFHQ